MTHPSPQPDRGSAATHLFILGCIAVFSTVLRFFPAEALAHGPACVLHTYLHLNCPFCGMTRDFVDILHQQQPHLNPFSSTAAVVVYLVYPTLFLWAWMRHRLALFHHPAVYRFIAAALSVMFVVNNRNF